MEEKLLKIINHYGVNNQQRKLQEEVFELQEAIYDYETTYYEPYTDSIEERSVSEKEQKEPLRKHIAEELADVMVLLEQFKLYYDISSEEITNIFWGKVDRQLKRIEEEK